MTLSRTIQDFVRREIAKALAQSGFVGGTLDAGRIGGALPPGVGMSNPMTTAGDLIIGGSGGTPQRLAVGSNGQVLTVVSGAPAWASGGGGGASIIRSTYATRPAAGTAGRLWIQSDGPFMAYDDGTTWHESAHGFPVVQPDDGDFAWVNQGTATVSTTNGGIVLYAPSHGTGAQLRLRVKSAPTPPYTITAYLIPGVLRKQWQRVGLCWRQSSDGKIVTFDVGGDNSSSTDAMRLTVTKWNSPTSFNSEYQVNEHDYPIRFMRIADNNTNRVCSYSFDGQTWIPIHSVTRTDFLTADQVGFFVNAEANASPNIDAYGWLLSWEET